MPRPEPQFDLARVTNLRMKYPSDSRLKRKVIREESMKFKEIVKKMLKKNNIHVNLNIEDEVFVCPMTGIRTDREWDIGEHNCNKLRINVKKS